MLHIVDGDLVKEKEYTIFCHQVNCAGVMGTGIAKQIKETYPEVFKEYKEECNESMLGKCQYVKCSDGRYCVNMFSQKDIGHDKNYTKYGALASCLNKLKSKLRISSKDIKVGFPCYIGCGAAGGDWAVVKPMLEEFAKNVKQEVYIVKRT